METIIQAVLNIILNKSSNSWHQITPPRQNFFLGGGVGLAGETEVQVLLSESANLSSNLF